MYNLPLKQFKWLNSSTLKGKIEPPPNECQKNFYFTKLYLKISHENPKIKIKVAIQMNKKLPQFTIIRGGLWFMDCFKWLSHKNYHLITSSYQLNLAPGRNVTSWGTDWISTTQPRHCRAVPCGGASERDGLNICKLVFSFYIYLI